MHAEFEVEIRENLSVSSFNGKCTELYNIYPDLICFQNINRHNELVSIEILPMWTLKFQYTYDLFLENLLAETIFVSVVADK